MKVSKIPTPSQYRCYEKVHLPKASRLNDSLDVLDRKASSQADYFGNTLYFTASDSGGLLHSSDVMILI